MSKLVYPSLDTVRADARFELIAMAAAARALELPPSPLARALVIRMFFERCMVVDRALVIRFFKRCKVGYRRISGGVEPVYSGISEYLFRTKPVTVWQDRRWFSSKQYKVGHDGLCFYGSFSERWIAIDDGTLRSWWNEPRGRSAALNVASIDPVAAVERVAKAIG